MINLKLLTTRFLILVLVILSIIGEILSQIVESEDKPSKYDHIVDQIYYNRYHSNNAKYLVWLLVLVPVFICIPCLIWVWCSDHCLQILKYRSNMKAFKEKKLMNEIILTNLSDSILNKELAGSNSSLPPMAIPPSTSPPLPNQPQPHFHPQMGGVPPPQSHPPPRLLSQPVIGGSQYNSIIPTHIQSSPSYIPNLHISGPVNVELPQLVQQDHVHHHHHCGINSH
ncbi:transmembrane domain near N-terminus [Cryptosporidium sp. chipmunk genotype I]|uniref:transmembrane domain near N-terminus n=1 Tax=Cryptosporidium sp. chipmunk genotype I TaxID=1280935 RepID=UPI003519F914|nr:transmembrane domain near N-terminus [Cryptosporidium sp. chipmunk genotype I]